MIAIPVEVAQHVKHVVEDIQTTRKKDTSMKEDALTARKNIQHTHDLAMSGKGKRRLGR